MLKVLECLDRTRADYDVLRHPFYRRWSAGQLTIGELALYAGQYRHAVTALAQATATGARFAGAEDAPALWEHAREERDHVALWDQFAHAVSADCEADPLPETAQCAHAWAGHDRPLLPTLAALYAIESSQPAIAETKRAGLRTHYGIHDSTALSYFDVHAHRDLEHAAANRTLIEQRLPAEADEQKLIDAAEEVLAANWKLLDGVQRVGKLS